MQDMKSQLPFCVAAMNKWNLNLKKVTPLHKHPKKEILRYISKKICTKSKQGKPLISGEQNKRTK